MLPGPRLLAQARHADGHARPSSSPKYRGQRQHARASRGARRWSSTPSASPRSRPTARSSSSPMRDNRDARRLHPDRQADQRHGRRGHDPLRAAPRAERPLAGARRQPRDATPTLKSQKPAVLWFTGLSGAGKSTIANLVEKKLRALGAHTFLLDGDNVRHGLNKRSRLHRGRPDREHPPRRRSRAG